jgi:hypothetical protein
VWLTSDEPYWPARNKKREIIDESLCRAGSRDQESSGVGDTRHRLEKLYAVTLECVKRNDLTPMLQYARQVTREHYPNNYDLKEVQTAFGLLEQEIRKQITAELQPVDYPKALGLTSTVLGAGKQALAAEYFLSLAHETVRL